MKETNGKGTVATAGPEEEQTTKGVVPPSAGEPDPPETTQPHLEVTIPGIAVGDGGTYRDAAHPLAVEQTTITGKPPPDPVGPSGPTAVEPTRIRRPQAPSSNLAAILILTSAGLLVLTLLIVIIGTSASAPSTAPEAADASGTTLEADSPSEAEGLLSKARQAMAEDRWREAGVLADAAWVLDPSNSAARELADECKGRLRAAEVTSAVRALIAVEEWREAQSTLEQVAPTQRSAELAALAEAATRGLRESLETDVTLALGQKDYDWARILLAEADEQQLTWADKESQRAQVKRARRGAVDGRASRPKARQRQPPSLGLRTSRSEKERESYFEAAILIHSEDYDAAKRVLESCLKRDPQAATCHRGLGIALNHLGDPTAAAKHFERYLELKPDADDAARVKAVLAKFRKP